MIKRDKWPELMTGLRKTLVEHASAKSDEAKRNDPNAFASRKAKIEGDLYAMDKLAFDPRISDDEFWRKMALKPFYAGHKSSSVSPYAEHMLSNYLSDWGNLCTSDWEVGGSRYEQFKRDPNCYSNMRDLGKVIHAAKTIKRLKSYNDRPIMAHVLRQIKDHNTDKALRQAHATIKSLFDIKDGPATAFHVMTDLGFSVVKPDRFVVRIVVNMGLIDNFRKGGAIHILDRKITTKEAVALSGDVDFCWSLQDVLRDISIETKVSMRSLDYIFSRLGQEPDPDAGFARTICTEKSPLCKLCGANKICSSANQR
jgi:hypothetical protein